MKVNEQAHDLQQKHGPDLMDAHQHNPAEYSLSQGTAKEHVVAGSEGNTEQLHRDPASAGPLYERLDGPMLDVEDRN
jgi:hypothetical protein